MRNLLVLCLNEDCEPNICNLISYYKWEIHIKNNITNKISIDSYDAYFISIDFLSENIEKNEEFFKKLEKTNKPIIYVYDYTFDKDSIGAKYLSKKLSVKFKLIDSSVIDKGNIDFELYTENCNNEAYSVISSKGNATGICNVKNTKNYFILKIKNQVIMHDIIYSMRSFNLFNQEEGVELYKYQDLVDFIFSIEDKDQEEQEEYNEIKFYNDDELNMEIETIEKEIKVLEAKKEKINEKLKLNNHYKYIVYGTSDKLVDIVNEILEEMLNTERIGIDKKKEDVRYLINDINILVEVKGVNTPYNREHISQIDRHIRDFADDNKIYGEDINKKIKGLLIINPYDRQTINDKIKKEFYNNESIKDIKYHNICTIDTLTLLNYYSKWKKNNKSIDLAKIILNNNYIEPDFKEIIK